MFMHLIYIRDIMIWANSVVPFAPNRRDKSLVHKPPQDL